MEFNETETNENAPPRYADVDEQKAEQLGLSRGPGGADRHTLVPHNERRHGLTFVQSLLMSLLVSLTAVISYDQLGGTPVQRVAPAAPLPRAIPIQLESSPQLVKLSSDLQAATDRNQQLTVQLSAMDSRVKDLQTELSNSQRQFTQALSQISTAPKTKTGPDSSEQMQALSMHITAMQTQFQGMTQRLQSLDTQVTELMTAAAKVKPMVAPVVLPGEMQTEGAANRELVILKERNRATLLADEAIATGKAGPVRTLWEMVRDPEKEVVRHGTTAELIRVQNHFMSFTRIPPTYKLQAKAAEGKKDTELAPAVLAEILADEKLSFQDRARAAQLLGKHKNLASAEALVTAMTQDAEVDVVKEAQLALRAVFGMPAPLFDADFALQWLKKEKEAAPR